ncbi:MAG: trigger factor [Oligoflexia bacterium]|nr:trigger factor [Oligoflexia bacterium]
MEWKSTITDVDEVTKQLSVSIPAEHYGKESESALKVYMTRTQVKGFRPGKAPRHLVEKLHGEQIYSDVGHDLVTQSLRDLIREHKLEVVGMPDVDIGSMKPGQEITYTAKLSLYPNPSVSGYEKFSVKVPKREVTDEQVSKVINNLLENKATFKKISGRSVAQMGDVIEGSLVVAVEGEEASRPEPFAFVLGKATLPADVEEKLVGLEIGQKRDVESSLPETYPNQELRGKKARFEVSLAGLSERVLPELNDAFAKELGMGVETALELKMKVRTQLEESTEQDRKRDIQAAILDELCKVNTFKIPQVLIDEEIRELLVRYGLLDPRKTDVSRIPVDAFRGQLGESAERRVRGAIIIDQVAKSEKLKVEDADINASIEEIAKANNTTPDVVRKFILSQERSAGFMAELLRTKALEFLTARAKVEFAEPEKSEADPAEAAPAKKGKKAKAAKE